MDDTPNKEKDFIWNPNSVVPKMQELTIFMEEEKIDV